MSSSRFASKHERMVNECYPLKTGEGPVFGKISALTYYINSRPEKLLKVSAYLEKKVQRDMYRERPGYNVVTLSVLEAIMQNCSQYFDSFCFSALRIIVVLATSTDLELIQKLVLTFSEFCSLTRSLIASIREEDFFNSLTTITGRFARLCMHGAGGQSADDSRDSLAWRQSGMQGINAIIQMEDFRTHFSEKRIEVIVSALVRNVLKESSTVADIQAAAAAAAPSSSSKETPSAATTSNTTELRSALLGVFSKSMPSPTAAKSLPHQSLLALNVLCCKATNTGLQYIVQALFKSYDEIDWKPIEVCMWCLKEVITSAPPQFVFVIITEIFKHLDTPRVNDASTMILADALSLLFVSSRGGFGYSPIDLSNNLLKLLKKQRPPSPDRSRSSFAPPFQDESTKGNADSNMVQHRTSVFAICNALVCLLKNSTFAAQKFEVINSMLARAFLPPESRPISRAMSLSFDRHSMATVTLDSGEETQFRAVVWNVLFAMADQQLPQAIVKFAFSDTPLKLFETIFPLITHSNAEYRLNCLVLFHRLLTNGLSLSGHPLRRASTDVSSVSLTSAYAPTVDAPIVSKMSSYLLAKCRHSLHTAFSHNDNNALHYIGIWAVLGDLLRDGDFTHIMKSVALIFSIQDRLRIVQRDKTGAAKSLVACHLFDIANRIHNADLKNLINNHLEALKEQGLDSLQLVRSIDTNADLVSTPVASPAIEEIVLSFETVKDCILDNIMDEKSKTAATKIFSEPYSGERDFAQYSDFKPDRNRTFLGFSQQFGEDSHTGAKKISSQRSFLSLNADTVLSIVPSESTVTNSGVSGAVGSRSFLGANAKPPGSLLSPSSIFKRADRSSASTENSESGDTIDSPASAAPNFLASDFEEVSVQAKENSRQRFRGRNFLLEEPDV